MMVLKDRPNISYWNLDDGYAQTSEMMHDPYPERLDYASSKMNLDLTFTVPKQLFEYQCGGVYQGFKVILSMPGETLKMSRNSIRVPLGGITSILLEPRLITTSQGLRDYEPNQRQCFDQHERRFRFFKMYTQTNCEVECLANFTKKE